MKRSHLLAGSAAIAALAAIRRPSIAKPVGIVGMIKPTRRSPGIDIIIPLLPTGVGVVPVYLDVENGTLDEFKTAIPAYEKEVAFLAQQRCDLLCVEGAPPFMVIGYHGEAQLVSGWEKKYGLPIFTSSLNQVAALHAVGAKRFVGVSYFPADQNAIYARYFTDAGFTVLSMTGMDVPFTKTETVTVPDLIAFIKAAVAKQSNVDAIYILGGGWPSPQVVAPLERDLGIPVVEPVVARAWEIQKLLHLHDPIPGYGRLLAELP